MLPRSCGRPTTRLLSWLATALGYRVVVEAGLRALERTAAVILVDASRFAPSMETAEGDVRPDDSEPRQVEAIAASIRRWRRCLGFSACRTRGYRGERKGSLQVRRGGKQAAPEA